MQKLAAKHWQPGLVLAKPVENDNGMILAAAGTELSDRIISILESRGVTVIYVEGHPVDLPGQHPMALGDRVAAIERCFSNHVGDPFMGRLGEMFIRAYTKLAEEEKADGDGAPDAEPVAAEVGDDD